MRSVMTGGSIALATVLFLGLTPAAAQDRPRPLPRIDSLADYDSSLAAVQDQLRLATDAGAIPALEASVGRYLQQGRKDLAVLLQERVVTLRRNGPDPVSMDGVYALYRLGTFRRQIGPYDQAETALREALDLRARVDETPRILLPELLRSLADVIGKLRPDDEERETLLLRALDLEDSPGNHALMAEYYGSVGRHREALDHLEAALSLEDELAVRDPERQADFLLDLAQEHRALGEPDQAEWLYLQALQLREELLGPRHPRLSVTLKKIGEFYLEQERFQEAERHLSRAVELDQAAWGTQADGCVCGAEALLFQARQALGTAGAAPVPAPSPSREPAPDDPLLEQLNDIDREILALSGQGEFDRAADAGRDALRLTEIVYGTDSLEASDRLSALGRLLKQGGHFDEAAATLLDNVDRLERMDGTDPARLAGALQSMGHALSALGRNAEAERIFSRELEVRDQLGHNLLAAHLLETLGRLDRSLGRLDEARANYRRAEERWIDNVGPEAPEILGVRAALAASYLDENRLSDAASQLEELAADARERTSIEPHVLREVLEPLSALYEKEGRAEERAAVEATLQQIRLTMRAH